jgi:hypothetical protein
MEAFPAAGGLQDRIEKTQRGREWHAAGGLLLALLARVSVTAATGEKWEPGRITKGHRFHPQPGILLL